MAQSNCVNTNKISGNDIVYIKVWKIFIRNNVIKLTKKKLQHRKKIKQISKAQEKLLVSFFVMSHKIKVSFVFTSSREWHIQMRENNTILHTQTYSFHSLAKTIEFLMQTAYVVMLNE